MKKFTFVLMAALTALISCKKENGTDESGKKDLTIHASIAVTKTSYSASSTSPTGILWDAGDEIMVLCDGEAYTFTTSMKSEAADFTSADGLTQEKVGINPLTAYYGCTQFGSFTIPQNQVISAGKNQAQLPMYAYCASAPVNAELSMTFIPVASLLGISIAPVDITLNKLELIPVEETAVSGNVAGSGSVSPLSGKVSFNGNLKSVSAVFQGGASAKNGLYLTLPIGWFSVSGGMKIVLTYNDSHNYESIIWDEGSFASYGGSADAKTYKYTEVQLEVVLGARDYYVSPNGKASSKGTSADKPTTLDFALSSADDGSVIHLAEGTYNPVRVLSGDDTDSPDRKTFEIARSLTLEGAGSGKTILDAGGAYHAVSVTAPAEAKVVIKNLTIKGGDTSDSQPDAGVLSSVNNKQYSDEYGAGLIAIGSDIELENVVISGNNGKNAVGSYFRDAKVKARNIEVSSNTSSGNGCGLWVSGGEFIMDDSAVKSNNGGGVAAGLYIYAPENTSGSATVRNSVFSQNVTTANNCAVYVRGYDTSSSVNASLVNCVIQGNSGLMGAGFGTVNATVLFDSCRILENEASGNGCNYIQGGSDVTLKDCIFRKNKAGLGAAIYHYTNAAATTLTVVGCEFSGNTTANRGGAIYSRAGAATGVNLHVANSSFFENTSASTGSAIAFVSDNASYPTVGNIYSCTITGNINNRASETAGGAIGVEKAGSTVNVYNSIISNNTWDANTDAANLYTVSGSSLTAHKCVVGADVTDASGAKVSGAPAFSAGSMLSKKEQDGKTTVFSLVGDNNPAKTYGYDAAGLKALGASIDGTILEKDQWGNARSGSMMGAFVQ